MNNTDVVFCLNCDKQNVGKVEIKGE